MAPFDTAPTGCGPESALDVDLAAERLERAINAVPRPEGVGLPYVAGWEIVLDFGGVGFYAEIRMPHDGRSLRITEPIGGVTLEQHDYIGNVARAALAAEAPRFDPHNALESCR